LSAKHAGGPKRNAIPTIEAAAYSLVLRGATGLVEQERVKEEQELIYEVSWISELGVWRRLLRCHYKVHN
jgi:hypothetical protein